MLTGSRFMPHQRHVADVALEHDELGHLLYDVVVLKIPRQNGKTTEVEGVLTWSSRRGPDRTVVYTAQDRQMARARLLEEFEQKRLARNTRLAGRYKVRRSNGSEAITWRDRKANASKIVIVATTDDAGHGLTTDTAVLDEAFAHDDLTLVNALQPTMVTRADPQLWIVSTVGDGTDGLLQHYEEIGEVSLTDPDTTVAYFDWSATADDDRADPAVHRRVMPALGRTITETRIRSYLRTMGANEFDRAFLNRRPDTADDAKIPGDAWAACGAELDDLEGPIVLAVAVELDRSHTTIAAAGRHDDRLGVIVDRRKGTAWAGLELAALTHSRGPHAVVGDRRLGAGGILDDARARGVPVVELGATDVVDCCGTMFDLVVGRQIAHARQPDLDTAVARAVERPLGDAWAFSMRGSGADIAPLYAATFAAGYHRHEFPTGLETGNIV